MEQRDVPVLPLSPDSYRHGLRPERVRSSALRLRRHRAALRELRRGVGRGLQERPPSVEPLILTGVGRPAEEVRSPSAGGERSVAEELLHVEGGLIASYRLLLADSTTKRPVLSSEVLRHRSYLQEREAALCGDGPTSVRRPGRSPRDGEFVLALVPDAFMTLETLELSFRPLLVRYPGARLLLLGLPGLPNTLWPAGLRLDQETQTRCITALLAHLLPPGVPVILAGFGIGAHHLAHYCTTRLPLERFSSQVQTVILVNGFVRLGANMRRVVSELSDALDSLGPTELGELIAALHLWDGYTERAGREAALKEFWRSRRGIASSEGRGAYAGVQAQLRGVLNSTDSSDESSFLRACTRPLVLIHSTEDVFVDPREGEKLRSAHRALPNRSEVDDVTDMQEGAMHVCWLKAGHEVIQERTPFLLALFSRLAESFCKVRLEASSTNIPVSVAAPVDSHIPSLKHAVSLPEQCADLTPEPSQESPSVRAATEADGPSVPLTASSRLNLSEEASADQEKRNRRKQERAERLRKAEFEAELRHARDIARSEELAMKERRETVLMEQEDMLSIRARAYARECEMAVKNAAIAKEKALELQRLRRAEALRLVEDQLSREKAQRLELRRKKAAELLKDIENESIDLTGEQLGGDDDQVENAVAFIERTRRIFGDFIECRQKALQSLRRRLLIEEKMATFQEHSTMLLDEVRKLRRALRMAESHPSLVAGDHPIDAQIAKMRSALTAKEQSYTEFSSITKAREEHLKAASRNFQKLKLKLKELEKVMSQRLNDMRSADAKKVKSIGVLRSEMDELSNQRKELEYKLNKLSRRRDILAKERERVEKHTGHFCDTDLWIEGVLQRCVTKELRRHLKREYDSTIGDIPRVEEQLRDLRGQILELNDKLNVFCFLIHIS